MDPLLIFSAIIVVVFIIDNLRARELATSIARDYCSQHGLQFLDGTASLGSIRPEFDRGKIRFRRCYSFEYTASGDQRKRGQIILSKNQMVTIRIEERCENQ